MFVESFSFRMLLQAKNYTKNRNHFKLKKKWENKKHSPRVIVLLLLLLFLTSNSCTVFSTQITVLACLTF